MRRARPWHLVQGGSGSQQAEGVEGGGEPVGPRPTVGEAQGGSSGAVDEYRPLDVFSVEDQPRLLAAPTTAYDLPIYTTAKVHRDHHIEVTKALYSIRGDLISRRVDVRADRQLVRVFHRGQLVKVHPRQHPGGRSTDPADLPSHTTVYAMRDLDRLRRMATGHGPAVGAYATAPWDIPLPWTKMRQVDALLGLVRKCATVVVPFRKNPWSAA